MTWFRPSDPRVADELRYHRDRLVDDYVAAGMDRAAAERRAALEFGNVASLEEQVRDVRGRWFADLVVDVRYALRVLRRNPLFAAAGVLSLALGIGANAAIFSVINTVLLRQLPVPEPNRLALIGRVRDDGRPLLLPYRLSVLMRDELRPIAGVLTVGTADQTVVVDGEDELVSLDLVSGSYFDVLNVRPQIGRALTSADDVPSPAMPAALISDGFWQRRFGARADIVGRTIAIRDRPFTVIGVTAP